ncbi:hypothetical protein NitYY0826_C1521 [Nitratiruptor sp. YY08-26]|uniref:hypothetical protein n=1 Tax=unclassified Nitratiruptor TaxID=2624044 RepID=UPI001915124A|nr:MULTISPECIES: hypothetical protein [unclassified Nitratiruptor]BCD62639.1 hypothetical protein NitYY0813_C1519 [Nitratiruptor sp. YY08-13]BCD66575.1 hypothetical protein NitYY0826_C1521 [Nitratiruptor sp. YY08-26]
MDLIGWWVFLALGVGIWAGSMNRSFIFYFLVSLFFTPIIGALMLIIAGKGD